MSLYGQIKELEADMFDGVHRAYKAIDSRNRDNAKAFIAALEVMNEEYKELTKIDYVNQKTILDLYERLWSMSNG